MSKRELATFAAPPVKVLCFKLYITYGLENPIFNLCTFVTNKWSKCSEKNYDNTGVKIRAETSEFIMSAIEEDGILWKYKCVNIEGSDLSSSDENIFIENVLNICRDLKVELSLKELILEFFYRESQKYKV